MAIQSARLPQPDEPFDGSIGLDAIDPSAAIGEQLRELRQVKNLPLHEVGEMTSRNAERVFKNIM